MRERASDGGFTGSGRPIEEYAALGAQAEFARKRVVLQRKHDVDIEAANDVIDALEIGQVDVLDFAEIDVAGKALGAQVFDEGIRVERALSGEPGAGGLEL